MFKRLSLPRLDIIRPPAHVQEWLDEQDDRVLSKLIECGLISGQRATAGTPIKSHLEEFRKHIGDDTRHAKITEAAIKKIIKGYGFKIYRDIVGSKLKTYLQGRLKAGELSQRTYYFYLSAMKHFCRWMIADNRASQNPLEHLAGVDITERKKNRRALTLDEIGYLLGWLESKAGTICGLTGADRSLLYRLALTTGLRAGEIKALTIDCIDFQGKTLTLAGAYTKNKKMAILPLRDDILKDLKAQTAGKLPGATVFKMPYKTARMIHLDMDGARKLWIKQAGDNPDEIKRREKSDFLKLATDAGDIDFHSLRHSFGSMLAASGIHPKTAQTLMRHSTIALTMDKYTHTYKEAETAAIAALPTFQAIRDTKQATGTDDSEAVSSSLSDYLSDSGTKTGVSVRT